MCYILETNNKKNIKSVREIQYKLENISIPKILTKVHLKVLLYPKIGTYAYFHKNNYWFILSMSINSWLKN